MNGKITVLLIEKDPQITQLLLLLMTEPAWPPLPFTLVCVDGLDAAREALGADDSIQVVLLDAAMSGSSLIEAPLKERRAVLCRLAHAALRA